MKLAVLVLTAAGFRESHGFSFPPCEVCGCNFCAEGEFPMGNVSGEIDVEAFNGLQSVSIERYGLTIGDIITNLGFEESVPCSLVDMFGLSGGFPPETCVDLFRLNPAFRESCGCPPLPPSPPIALDSLTLAPAAFATTTPVFAPTSRNPRYAPTSATPVAATRVDTRGSSWSRTFLPWLGITFALFSLGSLLALAFGWVSCCNFPETMRRNTPSNTPALEFTHETIEAQRTYLAAIEKSNLEKAIESSIREFHT